MAYIPSGGSAIGKVLGLGYPGNVSRDRDAIIHARAVQSTDASAIPFGSPVALNPNNSVSLWGTVATSLTTALTAVPTTTLAVVALTQSAPAGANVVLVSGANTQIAVLADAVAVGATSLTVTSFTPNYTYPIGTATNIENTVAQLLGIAVREVKQATDYYPGSGGASSQYLPGQPCDVLERGSVTEICQNGTPVAGGPVYLRLALNATYPNAVIGGFEAAADGTNSVLVPNYMWTTGNVDSNGVAELTVLTRALP